MTDVVSSLVCGGCGAAVDALSMDSFRCPNAGLDDGDHVVDRVLDVTRVAWPESKGASTFVEWGSWLHARHLGLSGAAFEDIVRDLDARVATVEGHGFVATPLLEYPALSSALGLPGVRLFVKDETRNVGGSHKGRHLMGIWIHLAVLERLKVRPQQREHWAIASCGNAALAAAILARAAQKPLDVFVPPDAAPSVLARLEALGARLHLCPRVKGTTGDPCYREFLAALDLGAVPFCVQGPAAGITLEGGRTLPWEVIRGLNERSVAVDRLFVQVGGGALASSCIRGWREAHEHGAWSHALPRFHAVQTVTAPLARAYGLVAAHLFRRLGEKGSDSLGADAVRLRKAFSDVELCDAVRDMGRRRADVMWAWETPKASLATGILDDETWDWMAIVEGMLLTGGYPVIVSESDLSEAWSSARTATGIDVDPTGSAGLAGLLRLARQGDISPAERIAVIFTGGMK